MSRHEIQHDWFAWHPVRLDDGRWVWLRRVSRWLRHASACWDYWIPLNESKDTHDH
jgi:hypothetical protein